MAIGRNHRQDGALERLEKQLESGVKTKKKSFTETEALSDTDKKRIKREIEILKGRS
jgi:hypothetical protein